MFFPSSTMLFSCALPRASFLRSGVIALAIAMVGTLWPAAAHALTLAWDPANDGVTVGYYVTVGLAPGAPLAAFDVGAVTQTALPLPVGSRYYVAVGGYTASRQPGPASELVVDLASPPGRAERLTASVSGGNVTLAWAPPNSGGAPVGYLLSAGTMPGAANLVNGLPVGPGTTVGGALPPGTYYARIHAANVVGIGPPSNEVMFQVGGATPPGAPRSLRVSWNGRRANFTWAAPSGGGATSYVIEAGTAPGLANIGAFNVGNANSFAIDVPPGTYYLRVRAVGPTGTSAPSNELTLR